MEDWRLQGQEAYLKSAELLFSDYRPYGEDWDHDHCEFCQGKFAVSGGDFNVGYVTSDRHRWICKNCFEDFKAQFAFVKEA